MHNKEYDKKYNREYARRNPENPEHKRIRNLKLRYGISVEEYNGMFSRQEGKCAICGKKSTESLCVDHDHKTGKIRGLLCRRCNVLLALVEDGEKLSAMQKYLLPWRSE